MRQKNINHKDKSILFIKGFAIVGLIFFAFFGPVNILYGFHFIGYYELFDLPLLIAIIWLANRGKVELAGDIVLAMMVVLLTGQLVNGGLFGSALLWFYTFPILSYFLKGTRRGMAWIAGQIAICIAVFLIDRFYFVEVFPFSIETLLMFVASYLAVSALLGVYQVVIDRIDRILQQQMEDLKMYEAVIKNVSQHVIITDTEGKIVYANEAVEKITGYSNAEVIGNRPSLWGKQMPEQFYKELWSTIKEKKQSFIGEVTNKRKNGELYTAYAVISPVLDEQGDLIFFVGVENDITVQKNLEKTLVSEKEAMAKKNKAILNLLEDIDAEKKKAEQMVVERTKELQDEKARLLASINSLSFGFIIADTHHQIILKNRAMTELLGSSDSATQSVKDISKILGGNLDIQTQIEKCLKGTINCEIKGIVFDKKSLRGIVAPIMIGVRANELLGYVFLLEDITEAKVMERSREEFFAVASHELRTPLTAIHGNMEMLRDFSSKIKAKEKMAMVQDAYDASTRLIGIVNDFLDVSRLEQGRITFKKESFDIASIVTSAVTKVAPLAKNKGLTIIFKQSKSVPPRVFADPDRTTQILFNLLGNAINYTDKGSLTVTIGKKDTSISISITDTGKGISPKNQVLLFRKFQQAGESILTRDVTKGTGLGLYISKLIVEAMGGTIELTKSVPGQGSTFSFTLPLVP